MKAERFLHTFLEHRDQLEALVFRRIGCRATASDVVQDLFLRLWHRPREDVDSAVGYLFRSARNLAIDYMRAERTRQGWGQRSVSEQHCAEPVPPDVALDVKEDLASVEEALRALPERVRHAFLLNRVHGRTYADIARALNVSVSTVEKDMMRALAACKASLNRGEHS